MSDSAKLPQLILKVHQMRLMLQLYEIDAPAFNKLVVAKIYYFRNI